MTDYQKLVDILIDELPEEHPWIGNIKGIVDRLIANGVTFATANNVGSKWIPVTERLPDDDSDVLAYLRIGEEGRIYPANYANGVWWDCLFNTPATKTTTHWMPLPKPPKEERRTP